MFINPINSVQNNYSKNLTNIRFKQTIPMELKRDTVSFKASVNANVIRANQAKIMFAQDVWTKNFNTIMPENEIQKEALLEILENLKYLQGYLKQKAKKYMILNEISRANDLTLNDPNNPELAVLNKKLDNYGNLDAVLSTLDKKIEQEEKRNRSAFEYFENLAKLQEEYLDYTEIPDFEEEIDRITAEFQDQLDELTAWETVIDEQITTNSAELEEVNAYLESYKSMLSTNIQEDFNFGLNG